MVSRKVETIRQEHLEKESLFIKMDVEGAEPQVVRGARNTLRRSEHVSLAICTYHCASHEKLFRRLFHGWSVKNAQGYMIYYYDFKLKPPYTRRGVLKIQKP